MKSESAVQELIRRVGALNPDVGEIGAGMLRQLVALSQMAMAETQSECASRLGKLGHGIRKTISEEERERRRKSVAKARAARVVKAAERAKRKANGTYGVIDPKISAEL